MLMIKIFFNFLIHKLQG